MELFVFPVESAFGTVRLIWDRERGRVVRVFLPRRVFLPGCEDGTHAGAIVSKRGETPRAAGAVLRGLGRVLEGRGAEFDIAVLDLDVCTFFQRRVLLIERRIPRGSVSTYGELARALGEANKARAVGNALAANPFPLIIPCHRVVRSDGSLGGFQGGKRMKEKLLKMEGVEISGGGTVDAGFIRRFE